MSRLANKPIKIPSGVEVKVEKNKVAVKGKRGELSRQFDNDVVVTVDTSTVSVNPPAINSTDKEEMKANKKKHSAELGLVWKLISNMIEGVHTGYKKVLQLEGTGYRSNIQGDILTLQLGFSNDLKLTVPKDLKVTVEKDTKITIEGNDKESVGQFAIIIKKKRPVEPYKGKGVRFEGERVKRKESKKASK